MRDQPLQGRGDVHRTGSIPQGAHTFTTHAARATPTTSSSEFYLAPGARYSSGGKIIMRLAIGCESEDMVV